MNYRDPDMIKIISSFFPIMHLSAQKGGRRGNKVEFTNTVGCDQENEVYLLQNKLEYLNQFEKGSTKQAQIDYTALVQFIDSLTEVMEKNENLSLIHIPSPRDS